MPFRLTNDRTSFMEKYFLDQFVILFIDDILVYSKSKERYDPNYSTHDLNVVVMIFAHKYGGIIWRGL